MAQVLDLIPGVDLGSVHLIFFSDAVADARHDARQEAAREALKEDAAQATTPRSGLAAMEADADSQRSWGTRVGDGCS